MIRAIRNRVREVRGGEATGESGAIVIVFTLMSIVIFAMVGFAVDTGVWYSRGVDMQQAAESAALAAVVWLPDAAKAQAAAVAEASKNGYTAGGNIGVQFLKTGNRTVKVTITDSDAPRYFSSVILPNAQLKRYATAQYNTPVPLGSPRSVFGSGNLIAGTPSAPGPTSVGPSGAENIWASINGYCLPREQGDLFSSRYNGQANVNANACSLQNPSAPENINWAGGPDGYKGYSYYVELPANRTYSSDILVYDGAFHTPSPAGDTSYNTGTTATKFSVLDATATPLTDDDAVPIVGCGTLFTAGSSSGAITFLSTSGWSNLCTIPASTDAKHILIRVSDDPTITGVAADLLTSSAVNNYSLGVRRNGYATAVCDSITDSLCPQMYAKDWMSVYMNFGSANAYPYLANVGPENRGKIMNITLFDPGEGGNYIEILDPRGLVYPFTWKTVDSNPAEMSGFTSLSSSTPVTQLNLNQTTTIAYHASNSIYSDRTLRLTVNLPADYGVAPTWKDSGGKPMTWWRVHYNSTGAVTDRTTWSVRIEGDPVNLVDVGE